MTSTYEKDDRVTVPELPEWGVGVVEFVPPPPFDAIVVRFRVDGRTHLDSFGEAELQPAPKVTHA